MSKTSVTCKGGGKESKKIVVESEKSKIPSDTKNVVLSRRRFKKVGDYSWLTHVESLYLRWNLIKKIENLECLTTLTHLEFYDNQITKVENLETLVNLETLDLSFNRITKIENLEKLTKLKTLFFVHNKITKIEGLEALTELECLELGDNRISKIENLDNNLKLDRLFLGANQIRDIENVGHLKELTVLSLPANAITVIDNISGLTKLKEIYLAQNGIKYIHGIDDHLPLEILDLNQNRLEKVENIYQLSNLTDFWARSNKLSDWSILDELVRLPRLNCVYLENNPFSEVDTYREKVIRFLPQICRLDSNATEILEMNEESTEVKELEEKCQKCRIGIGRVKRCQEHKKPRRGRKEVKEEVEKIYEMILTRLTEIAKCPLQTHTLRDVLFRPMLRDLKLEDNVENMNWLENIYRKVKCMLMLDQDISLKLKCQISIMCSIEVPKELKTQLPGTVEYDTKNRIEMISWNGVFFWGKHSQKDKLRSGTTRISKEKKKEKLYLANAITPNSILTTGPDDESILAPINASINYEQDWLPKENGHVQGFLLCGAENVPKFLPLEYVNCDNTHVIGKRFQGKLFLLNGIYVFTSKSNESMRKKEENTSNPSPLSPIEPKTPYNSPEDTTAKTQNSDPTIWKPVTSPLNCLSSIIPPAYEMSKREILVVKRHIVEERINMKCVLVGLNRALLFSGGSYVGALMWKIYEKILGTSIERDLSISSINSFVSKATRLIEEQIDMREVYGDTINGYVFLREIQKVLEENRVPTTEQSSNYLDGLVNFISETSTTVPMSSIEQLISTFLASI